MKYLMAFLAALLLSTSAMADDVVFLSKLSGAEQVPPVETTINSGFVFTTINTRFYLAAVGAAEDDKITAAHIHCGKPGTNGPVIYPFYSGTPRVSIYVKGVLQPSAFVPYQRTAACPFLIRNSAQLRAAIQNGYIYVNVHTQKHPGGAVRGTVSRLL
jgi:CHRD domain